MAKPISLLLTLLVLLAITLTAHAKSPEQPIELSSDPLIDASLIHSPVSLAALPHNLPQYYSSKALCTNMTNSCSGHGTCRQSHGSNYRCVCARTTVRPGKTIKWGGNACQKKDVSMEFALFAGFAVVFVSLVAGVVGMLYSMGSEKLPSVIGAGVVGNTARH